MGATRTILRRRWRGIAAATFVALGISAPGPALQEDGERRNLTQHPASDRSPRFSPDGRWLAFESDRDGSWSLYAVDLSQPSTASPVAPIALTGSASNDRFPAWSPDGSRIAFQSDRDAQPGLYVLELDPTARAVPPRLLLEDAAPDVVQLLPDWSPDGAWIVVNSTRESGAPPGNPEGLDLFLVPDEGGRALQITRTPGRDLGARFAPDSVRIAFQSRRDTGGRDDEIHILDLVQGISRLTHRRGHDFVPAWAPDGQRLAAATFTPVDGGEPERAITVYDLQGAPLARLGRGFERVTLPDWSPDGRWIAYAARTDGNYDLWLEAAPAPTQHGR